jgi:transposase
MPKTKPAYTEEFKRDVLAYQASTGNTLKATAAHFGVSANSMREWRHRAVSPLGGSPPGGANETTEQELTRLRRENREWQMRCEILKKTVGIFSAPSASDLLRSKP